MKGDASKQLHKLLSKEYVGYVLITCKAPKKNGNMEVEMVHDGDPVLVSYLLDSARGYLDEEECNVPMELLS